MIPILSQRISASSILSNWEKSDERIRLRMDLWGAREGALCCTRVLGCGTQYNVHLSKCFSLHVWLKHSNVDLTLCVVRSMDLFLLSWSKISQSYLLLSGSSPVDGSSRKMTAGLPIRLMAIETLLFMPPLSWQIWKLAKFARLTSSRTFFTCCISCAGGIPFTRA